MFKKIIKVAVVALILTQSSVGFARNYNDQRIKIDVSARNGIQVTSPYARDRHRQYERKKRDAINYPSKVVDDFFRKVDDKVYQKTRRYW